MIYEIFTIDARRVFSFDNLARICGAILQALRERNDMASDPKLTKSDLKVMERYRMKIQGQVVDVQLIGIRTLPRTPWRDFMGGPQLKSRIVYDVLDFATGRVITVHSPGAFRRKSPSLDTRPLRCSRPGANNADGRVRRVRKLPLD
jgi:hypothetical protein